MSRQEQLKAYIARVEERLRLSAGVRGAAITAAVALLVTVAVVMVLNAYAFPLRSLPWARLVLVVALVLTSSLALVVPLLRLTRAASVRRAEQAFPAFEDRLLTFAEREKEQAGPFLELLAADTLAVAEDSYPAKLASGRLLAGSAAVGVVAIGILTWMIAARPGYMGYGASLLWTGQRAAPLYDIRVTPGNAALRRNTDSLVTAQLVGIQTDKVRLFARYASSNRWEPVEMEPQQEARGYQFLFASLPEDVEYYVAAGPMTTEHFKLRVVDMPAVTGIHVTYNYPAWTGMKPVTEEHGGDLRAIEGTVAELEVHTDRPLKDGLMVQDDGTPLKLTGGEGNAYRASVKMEKDGAYHIAGMDAGQQVRLSEDYFIATNKAEPPQIAVVKPTNDYHASPIEEVTVKVKASAEFGLHAMALHYSVNGGPEQTVEMLKSPGLREADGAETLSFENFKMQPGDVVSLYATAKDGHAESKTEISFLQADPFEREYSQSQSGGGGGGGGGQQGNDQGEISRRQKELIAATWKQQNNKGATAKSNDDAGKFLSDVQAKLQQQVMALSSRLQSRDLTGENESFSSFEKDMQQAADAMSPATSKLKQMQWRDAITNEQKALQYLLRAEATFRQIQVAFGNRGVGGGGGGSMGRDLASLLDLELDTQKNQYESAQTGSSQDEREKKVDEALEKLDALAKRQDELAQQERSNPQQSFQQRWQQEMLRREAEQLRRQMEQMAQNGQQNQQGGQQGTASGQQSNQRGGQSTQASSGQASGSQSRAGTASDPRVQQALSRLRDADEQMRRAASPQSGQDGAQQAANEAARRAAEQLKRAAGLMGGAQQQQASGKLNSLAHEADRIAGEERAQADRIRKFVESQNQLGPSVTREQMEDRAAERNRMADSRQTLSDDLSRLEKQMRDTARELAPTQPQVSSKLRDALSGMDENELSNRVQRTADWLRRGINPDSNGTEAGIRNGLDKLSQQLQQAKQGLGSGGGQQRQNTGDQIAALEALDRFRSRIESLTDRNGKPGGQQRGNPTGRQGANQPGQGQNSSQNGGQRGGQNSAQGGNQRNGGQASEDLGDTVNRHGGGYDGTVWGNMNTGNNRFDHSSHAGDPGDPTNPADTERVFSQGMRELHQLRQAAGNDAAAQKEIQQLIRQMQQLDPSRFPGNPALVQQLNVQVLSQIDKLELELRQSADRNAEQVRSTRSRQAAPAYQDAVADYYRRLSSAKQN